MKKHLSLFALLILCGHILPAQKVILKNDFPDVHAFTKVVNLESGYLVAGYRSRIESEENCETTLYLPFVAKLDTAMQTVWEKRFLASRTMPIRAILPAWNGYFILGNNAHIGNSGKQSARLIKLDLKGKLAWEKLYPYPDYYSSDGMDSVPLPDGDLLARIDVRQEENSVEVPRLIRLNQSGKKIWEKALAGNRYRYYPVRMSVTTKGKVMLTGTSFKTSEAFRKGECEGWIRLIDPDASGKLIVEKHYQDYPSLRFTDAMELETGGWWLLGMASDPEIENRFYLALLSLGSDLKVKQKLRHDHESHLLMQSFCWDPVRDQLLIAGQTYSRDDGSHTALCAVSPDWKLEQAHVGGKGTYQQIVSCPDGNILLVNESGLMVMR